MSRFFDALPKTRVNGEFPYRSEGSFDSVKEAGGLLKIQAARARLHPESHVDVFAEPHGVAADRFRVLRIGLREVAAQGKLKTLLLTSPLPQDGKSTIALNLATALAEGGKHAVLLLEADLHRPVLTQRLGLPPCSGLAEYLEGTSASDPVSYIRRIEPLCFYLLPGGEPRRNPTELLQSGKLSQLVKCLSPQFDWVLIDSTPVLPLADAIVLKAHADASLLVARAGRTPKESVEEAIQRLGPGHVLGIVLNGVCGLDRLYSEYYQYPASNGSRGAHPIKA